MSSHWRTWESKEWHSCAIEELQQPSHPTPSLSKTRHWGPGGETTHLRLYCWWIIHSIISASCRPGFSCPEGELELTALFHPCGGIWSLAPHHREHEVLGLCYFRLTGLACSLLLSECKSFSCTVPLLPCERGFHLSRRRKMVVISLSQQLLLFVFYFLLCFHFYQGFINNFKYTSWWTLVIVYGHIITTKINI